MVNDTIPAGGWRELLRKATADPELDLCERMLAALDAVKRLVVMSAGKRAQLSRSSVLS